LKSRAAGVFVIAGLIFSGCFVGISKDDGAEEVQGDALTDRPDPQIDTQNPYTAFQKTILSFTQKNCFTCHGNSQIPLFAINDVPRAYQITKNLVNAARFEDALLVRKIRDGHCGFSCTTSNAAIAVDELKEWQRLESEQTIAPKPVPTPTPSASSSGGLMDPSEGFKTATILFPQPLPAHTPEGSNPFVPMQWDLSVIGPEFAGIIFELSVQQFSPSLPDGTIGSYRFRLPRILNATRAVYIQGMQLLLNGKTPASTNAFSDLETTVAPNTNASLAGGDLIVVEENGAAGDNLAVQFRKISVLP